MANFDLAWEFTSGWEGPWDDKDPRGGIDVGHRFPCRTSGVKMGTTWGLTPCDLNDYVRGWQGVNAPTKAKMQNLTKEDCKGIARTIKWNWIQGDKIENQAVAMALFEWYYRLHEHLAKKLHFILKMSKEECYDHKRLYMIDTHPIGTAKASDGFDVLSDKCIDKINKIISQKGPLGAQWLFNQIKKASVPKLAKDRYNSLTFTNFFTKKWKLQGKNTYAFDNYTAPTFFFALKPIKTKFQLEYENWLRKYNLLPKGIGNNKPDQLDNMRAGEEDNTTKWILGLGLLYALTRSNGKKKKKNK